MNFVYAAKAWVGGAAAPWVACRRACAAGHAAGPALQPSLTQGRVPARSAAGQCSLGRCDPCKACSPREVTKPGPTMHVTDWERRGVPQGGSPRRA